MQVTKVDMLKVTGTNATYVESLIEKNIAKKVLSQSPEEQAEMMRKNFIS